jgi:hypothetical protein
MQELSQILIGLSKSTDSILFDRERYEESLDEIFSRGLHIDLMNSLLRDMTKSSDAVDIFTSGSFFRLASAGGLDLTLVRYKGPSSYIYSSPVAFSQLQLSSASCTLANYKIVGDTELGDVFDSRRSIEFLGSSVVQGGDYVSKGTFDIVDFTDFETLPIVALRISAPPSGDYEWAFDRELLTAKRYATIRLVESNLCAIFDLLGEVGDEKTEEYLDRYLSHPFHFVRWKAVKSLAALNPDRALIAVHKMQDDEHPDVRQAARSTLTIGALTGE